MNYGLKIVGLEGELQMLKKEILSLEDYRERKDKASRIECDLFDLSVAASHRIEEFSKEKDVSVIGYAASRSSEAKTITAFDLLKKRINKVEKGYKITKADFDEHGHDMDPYTLQEQAESIEDSKLDLRNSKDILSVEDAGDLENRATTLERLLRTLKADVKRLAGSKEVKPSLSATGATGITGIQLPKIEVPTFDGNILNWRIFWEQFDSAIHSKHTLTDSDKLTYLRDALKGGPAKSVIGGRLTQTSASYEEAVKCLQNRCNRPRVLHQAQCSKNSRSVFPQEWKWPRIAPIARPPAAAHKGTESFGRLRPRHLSNCGH